MNCFMLFRRISDFQADIQSLLLSSRNIFLVLIYYIFRETQLERDGLRERVVQLERDNSQLKFENETLRYRLHEQSLTTPLASENQIMCTTELTTILPLKRNIENQACSFSTIKYAPDRNERITRSLSSLNCILNR